MFTNVGPMELVAIAIIALLVLGPRRLPEAARSVGRGMREFKDAVADGSGAAGRTTDRAE